MATSTHWIASAVGMKLLEAGGTAADAAVGMAFVLNVVEPLPAERRVHTGETQREPTIAPSPVVGA